jgi:hypothetical protein
MAIARHGSPLCRRKPDLLCFKKNGARIPQDETGGRQTFYKPERFTDRLDLPELVAKYAPYVWSAPA